MTSPLRVSKGLYWDDAWYLIDGCQKVDKSCDNCWAQDMPGRFSHHFRTDTLDKNGQWNGKVFFNEKKFNNIDRDKPGLTYSIWNDLFHESINFETISRTIKKAFLHSAIKNSKFLILTKRPFRFVEWLKYFKGCYNSFYEHFLSSNNFWFGTSLYSWDPKSIVRTKQLLDFDFPVKNKFLSIEPLLGEVNFVDTIERFSDICDIPKLVITGCESGSARRPVKQAWLDSIIDQCKHLDIILFLKQWQFRGQFCKPINFPEGFKDRYNKLPW